MYLILNVFIHLNSSRQTHYLTHIDISLTTIIRIIFFHNIEVYQITYNNQVKCVKRKKCEIYILQRRFHLC